MTTKKLSKQSADSPKDNMTRIIGEFTSDFSENPVLLFMHGRKTMDTISSPSVEDYINSVWPSDLFPVSESAKRAYGPQPYIIRSLSLADDQKEYEWVKLVGNDFYSLPEDKRQFLLQTAGAIKINNGVDIKKAYNTSIY